MRDLREQGIELTALHSHMLSEAICSQIRCISSSSTSGPTQLPRNWPMDYEPPSTRRTVQKWQRANR